jgi:coenzyme F420-reducing hydrogenase gamma subunit
MKSFAVLQLSGCAGCEVSLLNASDWIDKIEVTYMPLVITAHTMPEVDVLLISGSVQSDDDLYNLRKSVRKAKEIIAVGICATSGGIAHLGDRDDIRSLFLEQNQRRHVPRMLPKSHPVDAIVKVDRFLPGCPPTPELFMAVLGENDDLAPSSSVCVECGRTKDKTIRPAHLTGFQSGEVDPVLCLVNQGFLCIGASTRGGCNALCTRPGHPCVGCRGPSNAFIEKESSAWMNSITRVFTTMTDVPPEEIRQGLQSPQYAMFLFQFSDYDEYNRTPREKEAVL